MKQCFRFFNFGTLFLENDLEVFRRLKHDDENLSLWNMKKMGTKLENRKHCFIRYLVIASFEVNFESYAWTTTEPFEIIAKMTSSEINIRAKRVGVVMTTSCWKGSRQDKLSIAFWILPPRHLEFVLRSFEIHIPSQVSILNILCQLTLRPLKSIGIIMLSPMVPVA